jgi:pimeloyl-ACP methyl ester carboxylesterase
MLLIRHLGQLAEAVYDVNGTSGGATMLGQRVAAGSWDGFQASAFQMEGRIIVAFRGTSVGGDVVSDAALGTGMNSAYFAQGEEFVAGVGRVGILCGHSLGGAIAQVVANRTGIPMVSFNAPGVAVLASRNVGQASTIATGIRIGGMLASAVVRPGQAWRDVKATFRAVRGLNICLENDVVSRIGIHYGNVMRIPGTSSNPLTEHRMVTMNAVLATHAAGARAADF